MSAALKIETMNRAELKNHATDEFSLPKDKVDKMSTVTLRKKVAKLQAEIDAAKQAAVAKQTAAAKKTTNAKAPAKKTVSSAPVAKSCTKGRFVMAVKVATPEGKNRHYMLKYPVINRFTEREGQHEVRQVFMSVKDFQDKNQRVGHVFGKLETAQLHAAHYEGKPEFHGLTVMSVEEFLAE